MFSPGTGTECHINFIGCLRPSWNYRVEDSPPLLFFERSAVTHTTLDRTFLLRREGTPKLRAWVRLPHASAISI